MAQLLFALIGGESKSIAGIQGSAQFAQPASQTADLELWEHHIEETIEADHNISETDRGSLIVARRGQGLFKQRVMRIESKCRVTLVNNPAHLIASHCKPWRDSSNQERLDGENGLLLTPTVDHLFDRGFISFEDSGRLIISPVAHSESLHRMGVTTDRAVNVGLFSEGQRRFLDYHRSFVLLKAANPHSDFAKG